MKTLLALAIAAFSGFSFAADEKKDDPIVGLWRGFRENRVIECYPDGRFVLLPSEKVRKGKEVGKWETVEAKSEEKKYKLTWFSGQHVHELTMNRAGDKMNGTALSGNKVEVVRLNP